MSEGAERDVICRLMSQSGKRCKTAVVRVCSCESWWRRLQAALTAVVAIVVVIF